MTLTLLMKLYQLVFNCVEYISDLYSAIPNLEFELIHKADRLSTVNTQDDFGQNILNLCNAGILKESKRDFHWNRVLTRAEFANIVYRIYNHPQRSIRILNEPSGYIIKETNVTPGEALIHYTLFYNDILRNFLSTFFYEYEDRLYFVTAAE